MKNKSQSFFILLVISFIITGCFFESSVDEGITISTNITTSTQNNTTATTEIPTTTIELTTSSPVLEPELPTIPDGKVGIEREVLPMEQVITFVESEEYHQEIIPVNVKMTSVSLQELIDNSQLTEVLDHLFSNLYNFTNNQIGEVLTPNSLYLLTNKLNHLPEDYVPTNLVIPNVRATLAEDVDKRYVREEMATALEGLFAAAEEEQLYLFCTSGYRSYATQVATYKHHVDSKGQVEADKVSARAGHSEHQTGLAMDVTCEDVSFHLWESLGELPEGIFIAEHAHEYGLIIRYPNGSFPIVGYSYEPWHLRYVGIEFATYLYEHHLTLEEFYAAIQDQMYLYIKE